MSYELIEQLGNCFILVGLDPEITDEHTIRSAIRSKQVEWSRDQDSAHPARKRVARQCLQQIQEIRGRLLNPAARMQEAKAAKNLIMKLRNQKRQEFEDAVYLLSKGKTLDQAIHKLAARFREYFFTEKDVVETLRQLQNRDAHQPKNGRIEQKRLPVSTAKEIRKNLALLKLADLYNFLDVQPSYSVAVIRNRVMRLEKKLRPLPITPENDTRRALLAYSRSVFKTEASRRAYDASLAEERLLPLLAMIDNCCDTGSIEPAHVLFLLSKKQRFGIDAAAMLNLIREKAARRNVPVNTAADIDFERAIQCNCGHQNKALEHRCECCSRELYHPCGGCGKGLPIDQLTCKCGFSLEADYQTLSNALASGKESMFMGQWQDSQYRRHPRFTQLAAAYDRISRQTGERQRAERVAAERLGILKAAIAENDDMAIMQVWNERLFRTMPEVRQWLPRIEQAFSPADATEVDADHYGSYIQVRWKIASHVHRYIVTWSTDRYPEKIYRAQSKSITRGEYERNGFRIDNPLRQHYYIKIFALTRFGEKELFSNGESLGCRTVVLYRKKTTIRYALRFRGLLKKSQAILTLIADKPVTRLPKLVLVTRPGKILPGHLQSGRAIASLAGESLQENIVLGKQFPLPNLPSPSRFRLFLANPQDRDQFELLPIASAKLRI